MVVKFPVFVYRTSFNVKVKYWERQGKWFWRYYYEDKSCSGEARSLNGALYHARESIKSALLYRAS